MSIKSLDAQILLPKANEVAKQVQNNRQHMPNSYQLLTQEQKRNQAENRGKVSETQKSENRKIKDEEKEERNRREEQKQGKKHLTSDETSKEDTSSKIEDDFNVSLGNRLDIKI